jgi:hypothetical protein
MSPQGGPGNRGGGDGRNYAGGAPNGGGGNAVGGYLGPYPTGRPNNRDLPTGQTPQQTAAQNEAAYGELMRDLARLRPSVSDDKDAARQYQELVRQAQQLDPKRQATNGQLDDVIGGQLTNAIDEVELVLRRKLDANDGSVRSANPRNTPPGYADAVAEYYKRLSKQ